MITPKHLATFLMGAAAGAAIMKYNSMTKEEQDQLVTDLKQKAEAAQDEAKAAMTQLHDYFTDMQGKGMEALKTQMGTAETMIHDFISKMTPPSAPNTDTKA
jgi:Holliday junction resolvasome RuvABC DNA-binding subunit